MSDATRKEMEDEAIARMKILKISEACINALKNGNCWESENGGCLYEMQTNPYETELLQKVVAKGLFPFHCVHDMTTIGELHSILYVSKDKEEWKEDRENLVDGIVMADVYNKNGGFDDMGSIRVAPRIGGLVRLQ